MSFILELFRFLNKRKILATSIILILAIFGSLLILAQGSVVAPFIILSSKLDDNIRISGYYHDSAACLIKDGEIISAIQEERISRKKHDSFHKILFCTA